VGVGVVDEVGEEAWLEVWPPKYGIRVELEIVPGDVGPAELVGTCQHFSCRS
jgi:hypothetical protein